MGFILVSDDNVFQKLLMRNFDMLDEKEKTTTIYKNYEFIYSYFKKKLFEYSLDDLLNALQKFYIVCIPLIDSDNPQQIFESINSTGAPLTSADLIRNYILMNYENSFQEELYLNYWKNIEQLQPESKKLEEVIRYYLAVKLFNLPTKKEIYIQFKEWWELENKDVKEKISDIYNFVKHYNTIYSSNEIPLDIKQSILKFRKVSSQMPAPFLMKVLDLYHAGALNSTQVNSTFDIINTYLIRRWLSDLNTNSITTFFPTLLKNVIDQCNGNFDYFVDILIHFLIVETSTKKSLMPSDNQLISALTSNNAYSIGCIRVVLETIENHENSAPVDFNALNIEHIMPQTPNEYWRNITNVSDLEYSQHSNLLGNITLCASYDNSKMGNSDFDNKKSILKKTGHLKMNQEIIQEKTWNITTIKNRTSDMIHQIIQLYPYYTTTFKVEESKEIDIYINTKNVNARAVFHSANKIEVLAGSTFEYVEYDKHEDLFNELIDDGYIRQKNNVFTFEKNYEFSSLSTPAALMLGGSRNGWEYWKLKNGNPLSTVRDSTDQ